MFDLRHNSEAGIEDPIELEQQLDDAARKVALKGEYWRLDVESKAEYLAHHLAGLEKSLQADDAKRANVVRDRIRNKLLQREKQRDAAALKKLLGD